MFSAHFFSLLCFDAPSPSYVRWLFPSQPIFVEEVNFTHPRLNRDTVCTTYFRFRFSFLFSLRCFSGAMHLFEMWLFFLSLGSRWCEKWDVGYVVRCASTYEWNTRFSIQRNEHREFSPLLFCICAECDFLLYFTAPPPPPFHLSGRNSLSTFHFTDTDTYVTRAIYSAVVCTSALTVLTYQCVIICKHVAPSSSEMVYAYCAVTRLHEMEFQIR